MTYRPEHSIGNSYCLPVVRAFADIPLGLPNKRQIRWVLLDSLSHCLHMYWYPKAIRTDLGPEFTGKALDQWAYQHGVQLKLIQAGNPLPSTPAAPLFLTTR